MSALPKLQTESGILYDEKGEEIGKYTSFTTRAAVKPFRPLTPAQEKVAVLIGEGHGCRGVARSLGVSPWTVRAHVNAIANLLPDDDLKPWERVRIWAILRAA